VNTFSRFTIIIMVFVDSSKSNLRNLTLFGYPGSTSDT